MGAQTQLAQFVTPARLAQLATGLAEADTVPLLHPQSPPLR